MTINCAIIDDEPLAAGLLESYVKKTPYLNLTGTYNSAITAMRDLRDNPVPLLFLDIQMPELSGVEFAKILPKDTKIIFTTAFPQYALEGYKVNALDYLLKPISYEDFLRATEKAQDWYNMLQKREAYNDDRIMFIKSEYKLLRVHLDDILYVEGLKDYVRICLKNGEKIMSLMSMKTMETVLPASRFIRVHRSFIVAKDKVREIDRNRIVFGNVYIPIGDSYKQSFQAFISQV